MTVGQRHKGDSYRMAGLAIRYALVVLRLYLGGWMLLNGLNHFFPVFPQPMGNGKSAQLLVDLIETGLFGLVKCAEILIGILLLLDLFVPVALVMSMPVSVVVWYNAILGGRFFGTSMAQGCLVFTLILLLAYLPSYLPMMRISSRMGSLSDLVRLRDIFVMSQDLRAAPETRYRAATIVFGLVLTAFLAYQLHPWTPQPAGAGMTPAAIATAYTQMAYGEGKRAEAERLYFTPAAAAADRSLAFPSDGHPQAFQIRAVIDQGSDVVIRQLVEVPGAGWEDVVDIYKIQRSRIASHARVAQPAAAPAH